MNFEQWTKEISKGILSRTDEGNKTALDKIDDKIYWNLDDEKEFEDVT